MNWPILSAAAMAAVLGWSGIASAQVPVPSQEFKDWRYACASQKVPPGSTATPTAPKPVCLIQQEVRNGNTLLLAARVRIVGPQKQAVLLLFLPPTLAVNAPIGFSIDQGVMATTQVRQCNTKMCWAVVSIGDYLLAALKAGRELAVVAKPSSAESRLVVSLSGFTSAFAALQRSVQ